MAARTSETMAKRLSQPHSRTPTLKDVAERAGVSIATVSYVINNSRRVSADTRDRVNDAIQQLGFRLNQTAQSLRRQRTSMIGLIVPDNSNPFFAEIARGVEEVGFDHGFAVMLCNSNSMIEREIEYIELVLSRQVAGIILSSTSPSVEHVDKIIEAGVPVGLFYRSAGELSLDTYQIDNVRAGYLATKHLIELGHRRIAHIAARSPLTSSGHRQDGYTQALRDSGMVPEKSLVARGDNLIGGGDFAMEALLRSGADFTGVFAANDAMAIGAIRALKRAGMRVPDDVSIVGVDDIILASYSEPPLTTVSQPKYEAGRTAASRLIERIEGNYEGGARAFDLDIGLVRRESTRQML